MSMEDKFMDWAEANLNRLNSRSFQFTDIILAPAIVVVLGLILLKAIIVNSIGGVFGWIKKSEKS